MMHVLQTALSKFLAVGLLAAVIAAFLTVIVNPLWERHSATLDRIEDQRALLGRLQSVAARSDEVRQVEATRKAGGENGIFLAGDSDAIKIAGLQALLGELCQSKGVRLTSTRAVSPRERGGVVLLGIQAQVTASVEQLQKMLYELETRRPLLFIASLHAAPSSIVAEASAGKSPGLDVSFEVLGAIPHKKG